MNNPPKQLSSTDMTKYLYQDKSVSKEMRVMNRAILQKLCCDRIKAHKEVENIMMLNKDGDVKDKIMDQYKKINQFRFSEDQEKLYINDKIAHFYLEMVNSDTEEHIFKYAKNEKILLEYRIFDRMKSVNESDKAYFLEDLLVMLKIDFRPLTQTEFNKLQVDLRELVFKKKNPTIQQFFKVPFQEAYGSLSGLNVILDKGMAYIYQDEIVKTVLNKYEETLIKAMIKLKNNEKFREYQENDSQFLDMREKLKNYDFGEQITEIQGGHKLAFVNIQQFSQVSFPPCMKIMHDKLVKEHHLKYLSRQQLQLFHKSAGMTINDCINFWRVSFSDRINDKQFEEHQYNIRHNFGLEGKRADYFSRSCMNIWNQQATPDYEGCPIKTFTDEKFQILLNTLSIHERDTIYKIMEHKNLNHYDVACKLIWDAKHPDMIVKMERSFVMDNPIKYYKNSREYYDPKGVNKQKQ